MKIGIIGAMDEEVALLKSSIKGIEEHEKAGCLFYSGELKGHQVIVLKSGIGKVNAAMATTLLINAFEPEVIINTGSAGGFNEQLNVGDIVISTEIVHHDVDVTAFDYAYGQVPGMPATFKADKHLREVAVNSAKNMIDARVVEGLIATGDSFMSDLDRVKVIKQIFPELQCGEMEAAAIAQVSYQFHVPFVIIRSLSDIAGKDASVSFDEFLETAATNSGKLILSMLEELK
ncbi:adenosylhomocysteine nucleosidase [Pullulanibacillus pueri]|uniref:5'-methylthioadenosine/S-adenosylhomocysteine nucleosidase n=1 Tax=Pullulanibacillus pueri TaxID=1437324 RepID=A0A8J2ZZT4_9BACL|nr:5'-methylthioadenosine/adenosylhomocysteine nucleosidase [Pullulanibacillus pueri]MBM7684229.1 adenosylhomocysteine nucleosidase [Pullulanibacillus pueri]GGH89027.1 5'-methylthioadenosine/S-adenosylhomocysteine nucleosidase [Pullulanibacillus pueri]